MQMAVARMCNGLRPRGVRGADRRTRVTAPVLGSGAVVRTDQFTRRIRVFFVDRDTTPAAGASEFLKWLRAAVVGVANACYAQAEGRGRAARGVRPRARGRI